MLIKLLKILRERRKLITRMIKECRKWHQKEKKKKIQRCNKIMTIRMNS